MSISHTKNFTTRTVKRHVVTELTELAPALGPSTVTGENHPNLVGFDSGSGIAFFYPGYEHIPVGASQRGINP